MSEERVEPEGPPAERTAPTRRSRKRRWGCLTLVLLVLVFVFGVICGSGVTLLAVVRRARREIAQPELRVARTSARLARRLDLTPEQQDRLREILERQQADFAGLRRQVAPDVVARLRQTDREMRDILTPQQQAEWLKILRQLRRDWLPPDLRWEDNAAE